MSGPLRISRADVPQLAEFAAAYLHQDYRLEHPTPAAARDAYLRAADSSEREQFVQDVDRFLSATSSAPWGEVQAAWAALGAAWMPHDRRTLERLLVARPPSKRGKR